MPTEPVPHSEQEAPEYEDYGLRAAIDVKRAQEFAQTWEQYPSEKLPLLIQQHVADLRYWESKLPAGSEHLHDLRLRLKSLTTVKYKAGIQTFIRGLGGDHKGVSPEEWLHLSSETHAKLLAFNPAPAQPPQETRPKLRSILQQKPILLVGGIPVPDKIAAIYDRHGIEVDWVEVYHGKGGNAALTRIRQGNVGAVVILEKLLGHTVSEPLVQICKAQGIPWAFGGNAGTAAIQRALDKLETRTAA